jgi:hypothetical protein
MLSISSDGYIRVSFIQLSAMAFSHLISGVDESEVEIAAELSPAPPITGYTEWLGTAEPIITIGWDWQIAGNDGATYLIMLGEPRSNVMIVDDQRIDLGPRATAKLLAEVFSTRAWQAEVARFIGG